MNFLPLILIPTLYFLIAMIKEQLQKIFPIKICAICLAVTLCWLVLLPLFFLGKIDGTAPAILMGMSLTGIMYKLEAAFNQHKLQNFWFTRIFLVVAGYYLIHSLLQKNWNTFGLIFVLLPLGIFMSAFLFQKNHTSSNGIKKRLEDCC